MGKERRHEQRQTLHDGVLYLHESTDHKNAAQNGLVFDVSKSGACIYTQQQFKEGATIKIFNSNINMMPIRATVRWCKALDENIFKVGLSFED